MDVGFTDEQLELRATVRDVLARECSPSMVRESLTDPQRWRPLWKTVTDLGWTQLALFDEGAGVVEMVAVLEEVGAAAAPIPLLSSVGFAAAALRAVGAPARPWQTALADGAVGALAFAAPGGRRLRSGLRLSAGRLSGTAGGVADATRAEVFVALVETGDGSTAVAVVRAGSGVEVTPAAAVEPSRGMGDVTVDATVEWSAPAEARAALALPLAAAAAEMVGLASRVLDVSVAHARTREQFGRPIGAFQGVKHRLADCYVAVERARSLTYAAAMHLTDPDATTGDAWRAALLAKAAAGEAAVETARAGVQVHGALGMTWEHDMHLYLRRAWQSAATLGDSRSLYREAAALAVGSR